jgi:hypothetical protein
VYGEIDYTKRLHPPSFKKRTTATVTSEKKKKRWLSRCFELFEALANVCSASEKACVCVLFLCVLVHSSLWREEKAKTPP